MKPATHTLRQDALTETYNDVQNLIRNIVWSFIKKYGGEFDEYLPEANYQFIRAYDYFEEGKGTKFSTFLYYVIWRRLISFHKYLHQLNSFETKIDYLEETDFYGAAKPSFLCLLEELGNDARVIADLLLYPTEAFDEDVLSKGYKPRTEASRARVRKRISSHLQSLGWTIDQIREAFREIGDILYVT